MCAGFRPSGVSHHAHNDFRPERKVRATQTQRKAAEGVTMYDDISTDATPDSVEYWKARSRQWQKRSLRAEREKTELIAELNDVKTRLALVSADKRGQLAAISSGDIQPTVRDYTPRPL